MMRCTFTFWRVALPCKNSHLCLASALFVGAECLQSHGVPLSLPVVVLFVLQPVLAPAMAFSIFVCMGSWHGNDGTLTLSSSRLFELKNAV